MNKDNPLLKDRFGTVHETVPFGSVTAGDIEEAVMEGMRLEDEAIAAITHSEEPPTFANTILPQTDRILERATTILYNLSAACTSDELDELAQRVAPLLTEHANRIMTDSALFARVRHVYENGTGLSAEERALLDKVYRGFVRSGALLTPEGKEELARLEMELAALTVEFDQNHLKELNAYELHVTDAAQTAGLPPTALEAAAQAAREKNLEGWLFTLHQPSYGPFMTYADNRELRRQMYMAHGTLCCHGGVHDNTRRVARIVNLRREIARTLGYACHADYVLERRMAQNTDNVERLVSELRANYYPVAQRETAEVEALARETEGDTFRLEPWDFAYYSHKLRKRLYDIDSEMLRPYLKLENVRRGVFGLATRLYGITFRRNEDVEVYHPDVEAYDVIDGDGRYLAVLYADFFPRSNKQSGAWMTGYAEQYVDEEGTDHRPHVSIVMNLTKPTAGKPSLLTPGEVETFLHEFGHALHGIFSECRFAALSGTNVYRDFVELPSQLMENYAIEPDFLSTFAFHYETGEPIPAELVERMHRSRNFQCGYACIRQLGFCMTDMAYYTLDAPFGEDVVEFERRVTEPVRLLPAAEGTCMSTQFGHIMSGGYSAGYYSYKWAEVLDADAFEAFRESGIFCAETAARFRREILSRGATAHPMELYRNFRGHEPTAAALMRRDGIPAGHNA